MKYIPTILLCTAVTLSGCASSTIVEGDGSQFEMSSAQKWEYFKTLNVRLDQVDRMDNTQRKQFLDALEKDVNELETKLNPKTDRRTIEKIGQLRSDIAIERSVLNQPAENSKSSGKGSF